MIALLVALLLALASNAEAACSGGSPTWTAASANRTDVNDCLTVVQNGDTINVPAGSVTWSTTLSFPSKYFTLQGAGTGNTVIQDATTGTVPMLGWVLVPGGLSRITGFTFLGGSLALGNKGEQPGFLAFAGDTAQFRFDHNALTTANGTGLSFTGYVRGVIDHNTFTLTAFQYGIRVDHNVWEGVGNFGDKSWAVASTMGTSQAMFIEDNTFTIGDGVAVFGVDAYAGSRYVFRYNTQNTAGVGNHGTETAGRIRSGRQHEYYRNTANFNMTLTGLTGTAYNFRGGTGFVFDNTITTTGGTMPGGITLNYLRAQDTDTNHGPNFPFNTAGSQYTVQNVASNRQLASLTRSGSTATATITSGLNGIWFECPVAPRKCYIHVSGANQAEYNGTFEITAWPSSTQFQYVVTGTPATPATGTIIARSPWDGNTDVRGYRALDQVGAGVGALISGDYPNGITLVPSGTGLGQINEPLYTWNNTKTPPGGDFNPIISSGSTVIQLNRDYYRKDTTNCPQNPAGNCTQGVGVGTRAQRPASCTSGVAWWATDQGAWNTAPGTPGGQGVLDVCVGGTWQDAFYTPYTYPHPLAGGGGGGPVKTGRVRVRY